MIYSPVLLGLGLVSSKPWNKNATLDTVWF